MQMQIAEFIGSWGLDAECSAALQASPAHVVERVVTGFNPDIKGLFMDFLRSMSSPTPVAGVTRKGIGKGVAVAPAGRPLGGRIVQVGLNGGDIVAFANQWGLDQEAVDGLSAMPVEVQ